MSYTINPDDGKDKSKGFLLYLSGYGNLDDDISRLIINQCYRKFNGHQDIFHQAGYQPIEFDHCGHCYFSTDKKHLELKRIRSKKEHKEIFEKVKFNLIGIVKSTEELNHEIYHFIQIAYLSSSDNICNFVFKMLHHKIEIRNDVAGLKQIFEN